MAERLHVIIAGRVQGVGFRYGAHARAVELGLRGWVRNLPDGRVEGEFEGDHAALADMLSWCERGPRFARVDRVDTNWRQSADHYEGFEVRR
jgi:acylphosphatase